jgi:hypothetical protein
VAVGKEARTARPRAAKSAAPASGPSELARRGGVLGVGGPDGVGKTTVCEALIGGVLADAQVLHVRFPGLLPRRDPEARRAIRLGPGGTPDLTRLRLYPPTYPAWKTHVKTVYLWVDFLLGWLVHVRPLVRRGGWVIFERGWWDHAVDPRRYRLRPPAALLAALGRFVPRADLIFVLHAPPEVIHRRRPELTEEELGRQMAAWRELLPPRQARIYLDTSAPLPEMIERAEAAVRALPERAAPRRRGRAREAS